LGTIETIGIRELKARTTTILRRVREEGTTFEVTYRGRVVARPVPVTQPPTEQSVEAFLEHLDRTAEEIGRHRPAGVSAVEAVRDVRREL
jgi:prevent-host-death family protein